MINKNVNKERALKLIEYADKYNLGESEPPVKRVVCSDPIRVFL